MTVFQYQPWMSELIPCTYYVDFMDRTTGVMRRGKRTCKHRMCWFCSTRKAYMRKQDVMRTISDRPAFKLVLTLLKWNQPTCQQIRLLRDRFNHLLKLKACRKVSGAIYSFEFSFTPRLNLLHAHLHVLVDADDLDVEAVRKAYRRLAPESPNLFIEPLPSDPRTRAKQIGYHVKAHQTMIRKHRHALGLYFSVSKRVRLTSRKGSWRRRKQVV